jgi:hypothetical protein
VHGHTNMAASLFYALQKLSNSPDGVILQVITQKKYAWSEII